MQIEKLISFHIERQFPAIYREDGQELVQFIKEYYKFLETNPNQSLYNGRRLYEYRDIDSTLERMLIFFQKKYLADLPFDEQTTRIAVKNILGLYRRKGTKEGLELFFRLFYDQDIKVYYPSRDILRPSDSEWNNNVYLEIVPNNGIFTSNKTDQVYTYKDIIGRIIAGSSSKATAIVDKVNFIIINNTVLPIVFLNNVVNSFAKSETIVCNIDGVSIGFGNIRGSLSSITVDTSAREATLNNEVGEVVVFETSQGIGGEGLVTAVTETFSGVVSYEVEDGGWGYTIDSTRLVVSNQIVFLSEQQETLFELIPGENVQDQLGNTGRLIGRGDFGIGLKASGNTEFTESSAIESVDRDSLTSFKLLNDSDYDGVYTLSEAISRAALNIEPEKTRFDVIVSGSRKLGDINNDGNVTEADSLELTKYLNGEQSNVDIIDYIENTFKPYLESNSATYDIYPAFKYEYVSVVAKNDTSPGDLYPDTNDTNDVIVNGLTNTETVSLIFDVIGDYASVQLDALNYNDVPAIQPMSGNTDPVTIDTALEDAFDLTPIQIGTIVGFDNIDPGIDYVNDVYALAEDSRVTAALRRNQLITLESVPVTLNIGEEISQNGIKALVLRIRNNTITVLPYTYYGFNDADPITYGTETLTISSLSIDFDSSFVGRNATIDSVTNFGVGKISEVEITKSGYGYTDIRRGQSGREGRQGGNPNVNILKKDTLEKIGEGAITLGGEGTSGGFWSTLDSHLNGYVKTVSSDGVDEYFEGGKRIHDNDFYQEYSYEVQSVIGIDKYETPLKEIAHVAGTKVFGKFNLESTIDSNVNMRPTVIGRSPVE